MKGNYYGLRILCVVQVHGYLIMKRSYNQKYIPCNMMDDYMATKDVGNIDTLHCSVYNIHYNLFCLKDTDYKMKIISTYGELLVPTGQMS